jgi:glycosyltransferase involved in cell wall biosynthesis
VKVWEALHISEVFERAHEFDLIHNHFDFLPLTYSALVDTPMLTTIHGFSSPTILPVFRKYQSYAHYVAISDADRHAELEYLATVHHGIDLSEFSFRARASGEHLLYFARIHPDKGADEAIAIARMVGRPLILAGVVHDHEYFRLAVEPHLDAKIRYVGSVGPRVRDELLGSAVALLHPIRFNEPFGLSVIEAMACGTPVIAYTRGSMTELIRDGHTGFLVHDREGAIAAARRVHELDRRDCRRWVEQEFTVERMVERYLAVYARMLDAWPGRRECWRAGRSASTGASP